MGILQVAFVGGAEGRWTIGDATVVAGDPLPAVERVDVVEGSLAVDDVAGWVLRGVVGHGRYVTGGEADELRRRSPTLGRHEATCAALIPIRKSDTWWALGQDERREILEERSKHITVGQRYLPAVARRLHHSRDLAEPFDFLTWFEFAPDHRGAFDDLVAELRSTPEWAYVDREIDLRLER